MIDAVRLGICALLVVAWTQFILHERDQRRQAAREGVDWRNAASHRNPCSGARTVDPNVPIGLPVD